jgi:2-oxopent-4-enoate/cis-2-oxohex-4-enoate hydratase
MRELVNVPSSFGASVSRFGSALLDALVTRIPIPPITDCVPDITVQDAYGIQKEFVALRMAAEGSHIVGRKIGVTSKAVQDLLNVRQPDFGNLLSTMLYRDQASIAADKMISPRAEGEIAFLLKRDLSGPGLFAADVLRATECVMPCFEIVDSRIANWKIRIQDTIADNASSGAFVLGTGVCDPRQIDLALVGMSIEKNGEVVGTGAGAAALGHPLNAVAWLANMLASLDVTLRAGEIILSGALSALVPVKAGDRLHMALGGIGAASVNFTEASNGAQ